MTYPGFPFQSHFATVGGHRLHYLDEGRGSPVVMVHGNPNWSYYWRKLIPALSDRFRCLACDHIGCGLSDKPGDDRYDYTLSQRVADLNAWLDGLGVRDDISLVVHDWGGMIGFAYAARHPERIRKLVVLNTGAFRLSATKPVPWQLRLARTPLLGALLVRGFNAFSRGAVRSCVTRRPMPGEVAAAYCAPYDSWAHRIAVHRFVQDIPLKAGDRALSTVVQTEGRLQALTDKPMFIGWGDRDFVFDHHFLAEWQRRFPHAELHRYPDCGHYILEDAADELIPVIREFLVRGEPQEGR
ncbi:MAG: alpha/beta fold hydrolase [Planctomycetaceae bacterium]|nr:alpha/beta fold hydrolase [Planctomycetaceae bacterium]